MAWEIWLQSGFPAYQETWQKTDPRCLNMSQHQFPRNNHSNIRESCLYVIVPQWGIDIYSINVYYILQTLICNEWGVSLMSKSVHEVCTEDTGSLWELARGHCHVYHVCSITCSTFILLSSHHLFCWQEGWLQYEDIGTFCGTTYPPQKWALADCC